MDENFLYKIAISLIPNIGLVSAQNLIAYCGGIEYVFRTPKYKLQKIPGIGTVRAENILNKEYLNKAENEVNYLSKNSIHALFFQDEDYPYRLKQCEDAPVTLFKKGNANLNSSKIISIVGTRKATQRGRAFCEKIIEELKNNNHKPIIVSGLAYGIDIYSHQAAIENDLPTVACLAHGFETIYPASHRKYLKSITENGALVTDFDSSSTAEKKHFIRRNRIIAGLADATIIVESAEKGGALVTAEIANSYSREVFAVPGRIEDEFSKGCNHLIKTHKAALLENVKDIEYYLNWEVKKERHTQKKIFHELNPDENTLVEILNSEDEMFIDKICHQSKMPVSKVSSILLNLEFQGIVLSHPGKTYSLKE